MKRTGIIAVASCVVTLVVLLPRAGEASCQHWQLLRKFSVVQANGYSVLFDLGEVRKGEVEGRARYHAGEDFQAVEGRVSGRFDGIEFNVFVSWPDETIGKYQGLFDEGGSLSGHTKDLTNHGPPVGWRSKQTFPCALEAPKPLKKLGKKKVPLPEESKVPLPQDPLLPEASEDNGIVTQPTFDVLQ